METKKIEKTLVAIHRLKTSLGKIHEAMGVLPQRAMEEIQKQDINPVAPQVWHYVDCDGKMDSEFTLEICLPVDKKGKDTDFIQFGDLSEFDCVSYVHNGPWSEFESAYHHIFAEMEKAGQVHGTGVREVYHHCDFEDQSICVTEIQIEVQ